jgi:hypothetical protein
VLEGEVRSSFGNNPDVSKALRVLTEQGGVRMNMLCLIGILLAYDVSLFSRVACCVGMTALKKVYGV